MKKKITLNAGFLWLALLVFGLSGCATDEANAPVDPVTPAPVQLDEASPETAAATAQPEDAVTPTNEDNDMTESYQPDSGQTVFHTLELQDGTTLDYALVLPNDFDSNKTQPVLLALPPGPQTEAMVNTGLERYWGQAAIDRGWVVLSPVAPGGVFFFQGSEVHLPEFMDRMAELYRPEGSKYHLAGISNGGLSAFRIALQYPERFHSVLALPGLPPTQAEFQELDLLVDIPVAMFVGEHDTQWRDGMEKTEQELARLGGNVFLKVVPDEGHVIQSLSGGEELFDLLESYR
jgi:dipeptidyl aminopeptidase/acylaminoacyl peptidase